MSVRESSARSFKVSVKLTAVHILLPSLAVTPRPRGCFVPGADLRNHVNVSLVDRILVSPGANEFLPNSQLALPNTNMLPLETITLQWVIYTASQIIKCQ